MLPKLKRRQDLKHPSTTELSGATSACSALEELQEPAGFEPKLGTGEGERKKQMRQAPVLHHHWTTFYPKGKQTKTKKSQSKRESPPFLRSKQGFTAGERGKEGRTENQANGGKKGGTGMMNSS